MTCLLAAAIGTTGILSAGVGELRAVGDTRTLSLYMVHTKETLTVTYKKDGRYIPSALRQLNHFLRDWRKNEVIKIDPQVIDLVWELHNELGSRKPVHIICGYRSPATNSMLKRIGRNVATTSMHSRGQAIDLYFPDVPTKKIRNSALVRQVGGVGYYADSGPTGFVHVDTGRVRHWPRIPQQELAAIMKNAPSKAGKKAAPVMLAEDDDEDGVGGSNSLVSLVSRLTGKSQSAQQPASRQAAQTPVPQGQPAASQTPAQAAATTAPAGAEAVSTPVPAPAPAKVIKKVDSTVVASAEVPRPRSKPNYVPKPVEPAQEIVVAEAATSQPAPVRPVAKPPVPQQRAVTMPVQPTIVASVTPQTAVESAPNPADTNSLPLRGYTEVTVAPASAPAPERQSFAEPFAKGGKTSLNNGNHPVVGAMSRPLGVETVKASVTPEAFWKEQNLKFSLKPHFFNSGEQRTAEVEKPADIDLEAAANAGRFSFLPPVLSELTRLFLPFDTASSEATGDAEAQPGGPMINRKNKGNLLMSRHHQTTINEAAKGPRMDLFTEDLVTDASAPGITVAHARDGILEPMSFQE